MSGLPWLATVSGFVVFAAEATGWPHNEEGAMTLDLRPPGAWHRAVAQCWFATRPGRHWFMWEPWRLTQ
ncbi:MAG TPA: hypothetical protein VFI40_15135 [Nocardioides sp.]|nr:hypothetical protein [Nocardioides sp.]